MSHKIIKENAIFIADSHYSKRFGFFYEFLKDLKSGEIKTPQLFLLGDIFDYLIPKSKNSFIRNKEVALLLDEIAKEIEVFYFEGNHDFGLSEIFSNVKVFPRETQPAVFEFYGKRVALSHGDILVDDIFYDIYCYILRKSILINTLDKLNNIIDSKIDRFVLKYLDKKSICKEIREFEKIAKKRVENYINSVKEFDVIVEGHYHQGVKTEYSGKKYINLSSSACNQRFFIVKCDNDFLLESVSRRDDAR